MSGRTEWFAIYAAAGVLMAILFAVTGDWPWSAFAAATAIFAAWAARRAWKSDDP